MQDIEFCRQRYSNAICKPLALQFLSDTDVAVLELAVEDQDGTFVLSVVDEKHYTLVAQEQISDREIRNLSETEV